VLDDQTPARPVKGVEVARHKVRGGMSVVPYGPYEEPLSTKVDGTVTFDYFQSYTEGPECTYDYDDNLTGGAMVTFRLADEELRNGLSKIYDKRGPGDGEIDLNRVPYLYDGDISGWCPCEELRLRFVRAEKIPLPYYGLYMNIWFDPGVTSAINKWREKLKKNGITNWELFTEQKIQEEMVKQIKNIFDGMNISSYEISQNTPPTPCTEDIDVVVNKRFWPRPSSYGHTWGLVLFNPTWFYATSYVHWEPRAADSSQNMSIGLHKSDYIFFGRSLGNTALHEIGHKLGLVNTEHLLGIGSDHNNPDTSALKNTPGYIHPRDIMDSNVSWEESYMGPLPLIPSTVNDRTQEYRPTNAIYLKLIMGQ